MVFQLDTHCHAQHTYLLAHQPLCSAQFSPPYRPAPTQLTGIFVHQVEEQHTTVKLLERFQLHIYLTYSVVEYLYQAIHATGALAHIHKDASVGLIKRPKQVQQ